MSGIRRGTVVLGHGAGGGIEAADLVAVVAAVTGRGWRAVLVEQPWRVAGKRVAPAPARLDVGWLAALAGLAELDRSGSARSESARSGSVRSGSARSGSDRSGSDRSGVTEGAGAPGGTAADAGVGGGAGLLVVGGRSAGARVACRTATATGAAGVVCLSFPLHPPGRPERSRAGEAAAAGVPVLVVQGERDPFGRPGEVTAAVPGVEVVSVPGDHGLAPGAQQAADAVVDWLERLERCDRTEPDGPAGAVLRRAVPADAAAVQHLARAAYQVYVPRIGREPAPMLRDYRQVIAAGTTWVAERAGTVVGVLVLVPSGDHLLIDNVAVAPDRQGTGLGTQLLRLAEREAVRAGLPEVRLYTNVAMEENLEYYPRRGYRESHRGTEGDYHRVYFHKRVARDRDPGSDR